MTLEQWIDKAGSGELHSLSEDQVIDDILVDWERDRNSLNRKIKELEAGWDKVLNDRKELVQLLRYILSDTSETTMLLKQTLKKYDDIPT